MYWTPLQRRPSCFTDGRYGATATMSLKGRQLILLKPSTYMNLSGNAVRYWMQKEKRSIGERVDNSR